MSGITALVAIVVGLVAVAILKSCRDAIRKNEDRIDDLEREIYFLKISSGWAVEEAPGQPPIEVPEKAVSAPTQELREEISVTQQVEVPVFPIPEEVPEVDRQS